LIQMTFYKLDFSFFGRFSGRSENDKWRQVLLVEAYLSYLFILEHTTYSYSMPYHWQWDFQGASLALRRQGQVRRVNFSFVVVIFGGGAKHTKTR
jgi:hypothetical protein